jgi:rhamnulokinase
MARTTHLAVDLGASSGRVLAGHWDGSTLSIDALHRFANDPVDVGARRCWNPLGLWQEILRGLGTALDHGSADSIRSVGVDTWGVDFALIDSSGDLIGPCVHYRDARTKGMMQTVAAKISAEEIFEATGIQFMEINTLYQVAALRMQSPHLLDAADRFLMMPDLFHWLLSGTITNERTNASTTQMLDARSGQWSARVLSAIDVPSRLFGPITLPGSSLGKLRASVQRHTGLHHAEVIVPATHDTGAAVLATPAANFAPASPDWCYLSSGTWSLMGVELPAPHLEPRCRELNFTNEAGVAGSTRLLKNIGGLWLFQQSRAALEKRGRTLSWDAMVRLASQAPPFSMLLDPDASIFLAPDDMIDAIQTYAQRTDQPVPNDEGALLRATLEGLALRYRQCVGWLEGLTGSTIRTIHIVGGGVRNELLCQMTADACQRQVVAGPVEATALGNVLMQLIGTGALRGIEEARQVVRASVQPAIYEPHAAAAWDDAYRRFIRLPTVTQ